MWKLGAAVAVAVSFVAGGAFAQGKQDFTIVNKTGYTIAEVYVAPSKSKNWEADVMGTDVLNNNESVDISFSKGDSTCQWDLKVVYDDKTPAEWYGFDLCKISKISLFYNRSQDKTWAEYE
jgi:hypothetical protein